MLARSVGEPGGVQDDYHFVFSSVSHPQWMILNKYGKEKVLDEEEYLGLLINPLCQSVTNIRKILGFRSGSWEVTPLDVLRSF